MQLISDMASLHSEDNWQLIRQTQGDTLTQPLSSCACMCEHTQRYICNLTRYTYVKSICI